MCGAAPAARRKEAVLEKAIGTSIDKGEQLDALAKLSETDQKAIVQRARAGEKVNVTQEATKARAERERARFTEHKITEGAAATPTSMRLQRLKRST